MSPQVTLYAGDNRVSLRRLIDQGVRVHSVVCDPPYGLTSIFKRFGKAGSAPAKFCTDGAFARQSKGFMGMSWDASGIERDPEFWRLVYEILLPGGYVFAFSLTSHWTLAGVRNGRLLGLLCTHFTAGVTVKGCRMARVLQE